MTEQKKPESKPIVTGPGARLQLLVKEESIRKRFDDMLGARSAAFISSIVSAVSSNQSLAQCEPMSVISAAAIAASMDLPINPSLGFAHIVPYSGKAQFQMGWKGFVQLGMRTGQYKTMNAARVFEGQLVKQDPFTGEMHFDADAKTSDKIVGYVFYFKLINGYEKYTYMTREACEAHAKRFSQVYAKGKGRWVDDFDAMAMKTVVKQGLSKWGVLSVEMQRALEMDQAAVTPDGKPDFVDAVPEEKPEESTTVESGPKRLKKLLGAEEQAAIVPETTDGDIAAAAAETVEIEKEGETDVR